MKKHINLIITGAIIAIALLLILVKYWDYLVNPWTRDGQVMAQVIQITPRVSGPVVNLAIKNNQFVKAGDILFEIDPRTYEASLAQAIANLDESGYNVASLEKQVLASKAAVDVSQANIQQAKSSIVEIESQVATNKAEYERQKILYPKGSTSQKALQEAQTSYEVSLHQKKAADAVLLQARASVRESEASLAKAEASLGQLGENNAQIRASLAAVRQAELNLEFTVIKAPVDGYVTNINLRVGSQTVANQPVLALVDVNSYWIDAFFRETLIAEIESGNEAVVTLMSYQNTPIEGYVESIGWGISPDDGTTGYELLPSISPTFEWIRLAQRIPVRVHLKDVPDHIKLRVGTTCSVLVKTKTQDESQ